MEQKIYKCDHCGKELDEMFDHIEIELGDFNFPIYQTTDLCCDCCKELSKYISKFCNVEESKNNE